MPLPADVAVVKELVSVTILAGPTVPELWASDPQWYIGGLALAGSLDQLLFGVLALEVWSYFHWFQNDRWKFKMLVSILFLINLAQTGVTLVFGFFVFVKEIGQWDRIFDLVNIEWEICLILEAVATALAQIYFLDRAYKISKKNKYVLGFCSLSITAGLGMGLAASLATVVAAVANDVNFDTFTVLTNLVISWKATTAATDAVLSSTIIFCLLRSRTGWSGTDQTIKNLVKFTFEAQCLPLIAGLFFLATYVYDGNSNLCLLGSWGETKLAAISVLHVLNSRGKLRHDWSSREASTSRSGRSGNVTTRVGADNGQYRPKGVISVFTETIVHSSEPDEFDPHRRHSYSSPPLRATSADGISLESFEKTYHPDDPHRLHRSYSSQSRDRIQPTPSRQQHHSSSQHQSSPRVDLDEVTQFYAPPGEAPAPSPWVDEFPYPAKP